MKKIGLVLIAVLMGCVVACNNHKPTATEPEKTVSFDPNDSALVDELMRFYLSSNIIPQEALQVNHDKDGGMYNFDCLSDDCFITNDLIDSATNTFFTEVTFHPGSSGDNDIYICRKDTAGFHILSNLQGQIDPDLGTETIVNGCRVIYFRAEGIAKRLVFNGKEFEVEDLEDIKLASKK